MATVAEKYGMPKFSPEAGIDELRNWARIASPAEIIKEHKAMAACTKEFPRYLKMVGWLETIAEMRDIWLA